MIDTRRITCLNRKGRVNWAYSKGQYRWVREIERVVPVGGVKLTPRIPSWSVTETQLLDTKCLQSDGREGVRRIHPSQAPSSLLFNLQLLFLILFLFSVYTYMPTLNRNNKLSSRSGTSICSPLRFDESRLSERLYMSYLMDPCQILSRTRSLLVNSRIWTVKNGPVSWLSFWLDSNWVGWSSQFANINRDQLVLIS